MTIEDLKEHGVLLPEEEWGSHRLETTVPEWPLAAAFLVAAAALVAAYLGDGGMLTWVAVVVFLAAIYLVTWLVDRAVLQQRERFREERGGPSSGDGSAARSGSDGASEEASSGEGGDAPA